MDRPVIVDLDDIQIRFTPDGRVSVVDAIRAVGDVNCPTSIWEHLKEAHPEILTYCEDYKFEEEAPVAVINSEGWEKVWLLLPVQPIENISCQGVEKTPIKIRRIRMVPKGNPIPARGERNIYCPYYDSCLDYAVQDWWDSWNCSQCHYRWIKQSIKKDTFEMGEDELAYDVMCDYPLEPDLFE